VYTLMTALLFAPAAFGDVLCPVGGGFSEIVPEDECDAIEQKSDRPRRKRRTNSQSPEPRELPGGTISGPANRHQIQVPHNRNPNRREYGPTKERPLG
jgi:hypothetical protein